MMDDGLNWGATVLPQRKAGRASVNLGEDWWLGMAIRQEAAQSIIHITLIGAFALLKYIV